MKILQICNKPPFPPVDGGSIAMNNIAFGLFEAGHKVKVISVFSDKHFVRKSDLPHDYIKNTDIELVYVDLRIKPLNAFINLVFSSESYNMSRFRNDRFRINLENILKSEKFDAVIVESVFMHHYTDSIRKYSSAPVLLRAHNVEYKIWEQLAYDEGSFFKRWYLKKLNQRLKNDELSAIKKFDALLTITELDKEIFIDNGFNKPVLTIPATLDVTKNRTSDKMVDVEYPSLFYIGAMDWKPNREGLEWFMNKVWPDLTQMFPELKLHVAGRGDASWFKWQKERNVVFLGEIQDAGSFIQSKAIMIVPLFSGSGMRVKIIEGMTLGKAIVSTSIGAEGIDVLDNRDILIADTAKEFMDAISRLVMDKDLFYKIASNARKLIKQKYDNNLLTARLVNFINSLK